MIPITCFAENFEDVILWRALQSVVSGKFVDLGRQQNKNCSVSLAFEEQGWVGFTSPLKDIVDVPHFEARIAEFCKCDVHWLRLDIDNDHEAMISLVSRLNPWVLLLSLTTNDLTNPLEDRPEVLFGAYIKAYEDGRNCFFVKRELADLLVYFRSPPNASDCFQFPLGVWATERVSSEYRNIESALLSARATERVLFDELTAIKLKENSSVAPLRKSLEQLTIELMLVRDDYKIRGQEISTVEDALRIKFEQANSDLIDANNRCDALTARLFESIESADFWRSELSKLRCSFDDQLLRYSLREEAALKKLVQVETIADDQLQVVTKREQMIAAASIDLSTNLIELAKAAREAHSKREIALLERISQLERRILFSQQKSLDEVFSIEERLLEERQLMFQELTDMNNLGVELSKRIENI